MSNAFSNLTTQAAALKIYYADGLTSQFNDECPVYKAAEKGKEKFAGSKVVRLLKVARNNGIGATTDGGNLPTIGKQGTINAEILSKFLYLRFGISGPMIKASQSDKYAFVQGMELEMTEGKNDHVNDINRQIFWNGRGDLAVLSAAAIATTTITVTGRTSGEEGSKYLQAGMSVDIYSTAGVLKASGVAINSLSGTTTATLVLDTAVTAAQGDIIVRAGAYNNELQGFETFLDGGTSSIYGVDRSLYPIFNGSVQDLNGAQLRLDAMQQTLNEARRKGGKQKVSAIFTDFDSERFYNKLLIADKRYVSPNQMGDGTFTMKDKSYLAFGDVPIVADKDCPGAKMYFIHSEGWKKYVLSELEWADETGSLMIAQTSADLFEVRLRHFFNFFHEKPAACAKLEDYISP